MTRDLVLGGSPTGFTEYISSVLRLPVLNFSGIPWISNLSEMERYGYDMGVLGSQNIFIKKYSIRKHSSQFAGLDPRTGYYTAYTNNNIHKTLSEYGVV